MVVVWSEFVWGESITGLTYLSLRGEAERRFFLLKGEVRGVDSVNVKVR